MTYLWQATAAGIPSYFDFRANHYMQLPTAQGVPPSSLAFRGILEYGPNGKPVSAGGRRYYLSAMLGVTTPAGNRLQEVLAYLKRSVTADGTHPHGTIYFLKNSDVRSKVRDQLFGEAVDAIERLGVQAQILQGTVPLNKDDVQGVVMGTPAFDWKACGSKILPGAFCDNFTSFGGMMSGNNGQTQLSEFLRFGAAGASGTVVEPFAILDKFPVPMSQVHYVRGCSLAEAFYQSVHGPYQLLLVGDPLCQPWANIPEVKVEGIQAGQSFHGAMELTPSAKLPQNQTVTAFQLFIDAQIVAVCKPGETLSFDTKKASDGYHELRVVAIGPEPIATQGRKVFSVTFDNHHRTIDASLTTKAPYHIDTPLEITAKSPGSVGMIVVQGSRVIAQLRGEEGKIVIPPKTLGGGPVRLRVAGLGDGDTSTNVLSQPIDFMID
jgi:hypothetical protein